jgi:zinc protease
MWDPANRLFPMERVRAPAVCCTALFTLASVALAGGCKPMRPMTQAPQTTARSTSVYQLANGMTVVLREDHFAPVVALQVWVKAGGADEQDFEAGVAHVHEHMLFKGTANRGVGQIASEVEGSGGRINAWTSWNETVYHIVVASRFTDVGLDVLADAVRNSSFDPTELDKELAVVLEEWKRGEDSPGRRVFQALFANAFTKHPYRRPVIGTQETIRGLTRERVLDFYGRYYTPNNMVLVVVGDFDGEAMRKQVDRVFGDYAARALERPARTTEPQQAGLRFETLRMQVQEAQLALGMHIPEAAHDDAPLLDLVAFVLGGGESSRLYRSLVAEQQIVNTVGAFAYTPSDPGLFVVTASLEADDTRKAYAAIVDEMDALRRTGPTQEELDRARINLESDFIFRNETVQEQARELGYAITVHNDPDYDRVYLARLRAATTADLQRVARKYFTRDNLTAVQLLPEGSRQLLTRGVAVEESVGLAKAAGSTASSVSATAPDAGAVAQPAPAMRNGEPQLVKLENGVRVIIAQHHNVPAFSVHAAMLGGVIAETRETNGITNFVAEMLTRGTTARSREQIARDIESIAASVSGFSGHNSLGISASFLSEHFDRGFDLVTEVLRKPAFDPGEIEKTRRELLLAIKNRDDNSSRVAFDLAYATVYPDHPYGMTTLGEASSVERLGQEDLRAFYQRALDPRSLVITVVGDVDAGRVLDRISAAFSDLRPGPNPFSLPRPAPLPSEVRRKSRESERYQSHVVLAYPSITVGDPDRYPLAVLENILSGQGGRLFTELRDRQGLAYSVSAFLTKGLARGLFGGYIGTDPANATRATEGMLDEFRRIQRDPVTQDELSRSKRYLIGSRDISLQTSAAVAEEMGFNELYDLGYLNGREYPKRIDGVSAKDVSRVATKYLKPGIRTEVVVGPSSLPESSDATPSPDSTLSATAGSQHDPDGR